MSGVDQIRDEEGNDNDADVDANANAGGSQEPYQAEQLALDEDDERLPWLESGDDDDYEAGPDFGRVLGMTLLGLVALAAIVGGIWWSTHRTPDTALVADGGMIKAPAQPYKEAPKNPGGKTFEGTGDTAFAVSEGRTHTARLGDSAPAPAARETASAAARPSVDLSPKPPSAVASAAAAAHPAATQGADGSLVQVGAYSTRASAEAAWSRLTGQYNALSGQRHQIVEGTADIGTVFRLQAMPGSADAAHSLCGRLKASGLACQVK